MEENRIIMQNARKSLSNKWALAVLSYLIISIILWAVGAIRFPIVSFVICLIISGPIQFGTAFFSSRLAAGKKVDFVQIFEGFRTRIERSFVAYVLEAVFIFLWTLLLIIPGIIASIAYSQTFYILSEDKKIDALDAITKSKQMMYGHKWTYFCLNLRFIGWFLLCLLTLGIGFLWFIPYVQVSYAEFYKELKKAQK